VALALGSHLIPALAPRNVLAYVLFGGCIAATIYNHAHYFSGSSHRAGTVRAEQTPTSAATSTLQAELASNTARPLPTVAAELAQATTKAAQAQANLSRCETRCTGLQAAHQSAQAKVLALTDERTAALRATAIRQQLAELAATADGKRAAAEQNPIDAQIATTTGLAMGTVSLATSILQSLMLEVMAALLWAIALKPKPQPTAQPAPIDTPINAETPEPKVLAKATATTKAIARKPKTTPTTNTNPRDSPTPRIRAFSTPPKPLAA
jgi:hypothetical protein